MFIYGKQMPISAPLGHTKSRSASAHDFKACPTSLRARRQLAKQLMTKANTLRCSPKLFAILCEVLLQGPAHEANINIQIEWLVYGKHLAMPLISNHEQLD